MDTKNPLEHNSFVWNTGGWFGSQIGSTVWMLFSGLSLLFSDPFSGLVCLCGFAFVNAAGWYLWERRKKLDPYVGFQRLAFTLAVVCASLSLVLYCRGLLSTRESILLMAMTPVLMTFLALQNWVVKRNQGQRPDGDQSNQYL